MKNKLQFDTFTCSVFDAIENNGGKVYIVGGTIRDLYIDVPLKNCDVDVEVYHISLEQLEQILSQFGTVNNIGKSFGIVKVSSLPNIDFALPRQELKIGDKHTDFNVTIDQDMDLKIAASRRDFTMNAMLYEYQTGRVLDFYHGKEDIRNGIIRMVNETSFKEDPLRVLRVARFVARYQYKVDALTKQFCRQMVSEGALETLSNERVYEEYCHILLASKPSMGFTFLKEVGALPKFLDDLQYTMQRLDYHPEGNVWNHTMLVIDIGALSKQKSSDPLAFMWSCLLHDIGKPKTTTPTGSAPKHHLVGVDVFRKYCGSLITSKKMRKYITTMIRYHMELLHMAKNKAKDSKYYRLLKDINSIMPLEDLALLTKCDKYGRLMNNSESIALLETYLQDKIDRLGKDALKPCINGETLLGLGYQPSSNFSKILDEAYQMQMQGKHKEAIIKEIKRKY